MKSVVAMFQDGTLTVPEELCRALGVDGPVFVELEVVNQSLVLRPGETIPDEDVWAYTPEHVALVERARKEGGGIQMSPADLERLIAEIDR